MNANQLKAPTALQSKSNIYSARLPDGKAANQCRMQRESRRLIVTAAIKKSGAKHVICSKTLIAKPDQTKRLQKKCQDILDFSLGKASNAQNGIIEFSCSQDIYDKNVFHFWERYDGNTSLGRHNTTPEFVKFMEGVILSLKLSLARAMQIQPCRIYSG